MRTSVIEACWANMRAADIASPDRAANSRAVASSPSLNGPASARRRSTMAPAGMPCPGSG